MSGPLRSIRSRRQLQTFIFIMSRVPRRISSGGGSSSQIGDLLNPVRGYRDQLVRSGVKPKDHMRDNVRQLRDRQEQVRLAKEEEEVAMQQEQEVRAFVRVRSFP